MSSRSKFNNKLRRMILSAMFLAIALVLPFLTGQIPEIGRMLCPMHIPVILCGFFCGPIYGLIVGFISPILRFLIFGMPILIPTGFAMAFELAAYGFFTGLFYKAFKEKKGSIYISLILSMVIGRLIWGIVSIIIYGISGNQFSFQMFLSGAYINAVPGIIVQLILIPILVASLKKYTIK